MFGIERRWIICAALVLGVVVGWQIWKKRVAAAAGPEGVSKIKASTGQGAVAEVLTRPRPGNTGPPARTLPRPGAGKSTAATPPVRPPVRISS